MGLKNTQKLRDIGNKMTIMMSNLDSHSMSSTNQLIEEWNAAVMQYEELLNKRKDKKNRKQAEKKLAKARGENK